MAVTITMTKKPNAIGNGRLGSNRKDTASSVSGIPTSPAI
jgi:hypothetical protein